MKNPNRPCYKNRPIQSLETLAKALRLDLSVLIELAQSANQLYRVAKQETKSDGTIRQTYDALGLLKETQNRIKDQFLAKVIFPDYLTGSLKGKDYVVNARLHIGTRIVISEDISSFFPSTSAQLIFQIWRNFFGFSEEVADLLTKITTKNNELPQGAKTSSYLANLVFWNVESKLYEQFKQENIAYSRYVDDITISSKRYLTNDVKTKVIKRVYGMLISMGYRAKRKKHQIATNSGRMSITKLTVNGKHPSLTPKERSAIRVAVFQLEQKPVVTQKEINRVTGLVGKLARLHPSSGKQLKSRVKAVRTTSAKQPSTSQFY